MLALLGVALFCLLTALGSPDKLLIEANSTIKVPLADAPISFFGFIVVAPFLLIVLLLYLHIFYGYWIVCEWERQCINQRLIPSIEGIPTLFSLSTVAPRVLTGFIFYWLVPLVLGVITWKAWAFPTMGLPLTYVTGVVTIVLMLLQRRRLHHQATGWPHLYSTFLILIISLIVLATSHPQLFQRPLYLFRAKLSDAWLAGMDMHRASLGFANLQEAYLQGTNFQFTDLRGANLQKANLQEATLQGANLQGATLQGADLQGANLQKANLRGANLQGADLQRVVLQRATLQKANLQEADLRWANFSKATLQQADLQGATLQGATLQGATLQRANLRGADLRKADLREADLQGANLQEANLQEARLQDANLQGATLRGANLQQADLQGATLQQADFQQADLTYTTNLTLSQINTACGNESTKLSASIESFIKFSPCPESPDKLLLDR
jgi:uncharacterized protein YjbI with pentapeptide repeats